MRASVDGPRGRLAIYTTHLNWRFDQSDIRQEQVRYVARFIAESREAGCPPILTGDFNAVPDSDEVRMLTGRMALAMPGLVFHDAWEAAGAGEAGFTWTNANPWARQDLEPDRRIDYVFAGWPGRGGAGHVTACRLIGQAIDGVSSVRSPRSARGAALLTRPIGTGGRVAVRGPGCVRAASSARYRPWRSARCFSTFSSVR